MKKLLLIVTGILLCCCGTGQDADVYSLKLPEIPSSWEIIPGTMSWFIQWQDAEGKPQKLELKANQTGSISLAKRGANAVFAWPYWQDLQINPGVFRPPGRKYRRGRPDCLFGGHKRRQYRAANGARTWH